MAAKENRKIITIAAGGTGGHIFPAISVAQIMLKAGYKVLFITDENFNNYKAVTQPALNNPSFSVKYICIKRRKGKLGRALMALGAILGVVQTGYAIKKSKSSAVIGFGSYVSLPTVIGGFLTGRKIIIHEQNTVMGLANRISCWFASSCACSFPQTKGIHPFQKRKAIFVGNPLREEFAQMQSQGEGHHHWHASSFSTSSKINILIMGGSQGAGVFKGSVASAICQLPPKIRRRLTVYHQSPAKQATEVAQLYTNAGIKGHISPFFKNAAELMAKSHLFIGRSGAGTISEISAIGVPSILIPYPTSANNHQYHNAAFLQLHGGAVVVEQNQLNAQKLSKTIEHLLSSEGELNNMSQNVKQLAQPEAALKMATLIEISIFGKAESSFLPTSIFGGKVMEEAKIN